MKKTATLNVRVDPDTKKHAETILSRIGLPMSTAIDIYLKQIVSRGKIPFELSVPTVPDEISMELMTPEELKANIQEGLDDIEAGRVYDAKDVFNELLGSK